MNRLAAARRSNPSRAVLLACLLAVVLVGDSRGQYTNAETFVTRSVRGRSVLRVEAALELPPSMSVGVMRVTISAKTPSKSDRDLLVVYYLKSYGRASTDSFAYRVPVRLEEGKQEVVVEIPHIQDSMQGVWDVGVFEDGYDIEDRRQQTSTPQQPYQWIYNDGQQFALGAIVGVTESQSAVEKQLKNLGESLMATPTQKSASNTTTGFQVIPLRSASTDWRRYFPYSAWTMSADAVQELNASQPEISGAIRNFVAAGGVLLVHSVVEPQHMLAVEELLSDQANSQSHADYWTSVKSPKVQWWWLESASVDSMGGADAVQQEITPEGSLSGLGAAHDAAVFAETWLQNSIGSHLNFAEELSQLIGFDVSVAASLDEYRSQLMEALSTEKILLRKHMFGDVLMTSQALPDVPISLLRRTNFASNRANTLASGNMDSNWFWRNLIQAVGKPPVWIFCGIVTLFGALLGPGLLVFTGRMRRRSLMIFLVPAVSLLATGAIVLYGIFHEGFDTHVRITSVQMIDQGAQQGFAWSRQNYFSGLPPREGLDFGWDTFARPVYAEDTPRYGGNINPRDGVNCNVTFVDKQNWRGWLRPRQQQQLLVGHALHSVTLPITIQRDESGDVLVRNRTAQELPIVLFRGASNDYYFCEKLAADSETTAVAQDKPSASAEVARAIVDYRPKPPPELNEGGSLLSFGSGRSRYRNRNVYETEDLLNMAYRQYMSEKFDLPPFGFAVLATDSQAVEVPLQGRASENVHLVIGVEPW
jgi:hypothetical protein